MIYTDIYLINKITENIFNLESIKLNLKEINCYQLKIYVYGDKYLILENNKKKCYSMENLSYLHKNNIMVNKIKFNNIDIQSFPFIDKYDNIIFQKIKMFKHPLLNINFYLIEEENNNFIRIEKNLNDYELVEFMKLIGLKNI